MRKFLVLLLAVSLLAVSFSGCNKTREPDVWDGSIAENFAGGDGSEKNPYKIEKASQLALLAQEVNSGTDYKGKFFSLKNDLNLNSCEWAPIGNGNNSFNGIFDGNNHTISNLKITNGFAFTWDGETKQQYTTGLFGSCYNTTIKNITIDKASVTIQNINNAHNVTGGILVGTLRSDSTAEISNVSIVDANIACAFECENNSSSLCVGGIIGTLTGNNNSSIIMKNINTNTDISIENGSASANAVGGIVGWNFIGHLFDISNCASYLSVNINTETCYSQYNSFGAFGAMVNLNNVSIINVFSKVTTNKIRDISHGSFAYDANAIIGCTLKAKIGEYDFINLFGYVEQADASTGETVKSMQLYEIPSDVVYNEINCLGCESLPTGHVFDAYVWDLTDLSNPKVL